MTSSHRLLRNIFMKFMSLLYNFNLYILITVNINFHEYSESSNFILYIHFQSFEAFVKTLNLTFTLISISTSYHHVPIKVGLKIITISVSYADT